MQKNNILILVVIAIVGVIFSIDKFTSSNNSLNRQDLILKCQELYNTKVFEKKADSVIYSDETESCLALFRENEIGGGFSSFNSLVMDISNEYILLSYSASNFSEECKKDGINLFYYSLTNKLNKKLSGYGCSDAFDFDPLSSFEKTAVKLGFKQFEY